MDPNTLRYADILSCQTVYDLRQISFVSFRDSFGLHGFMNQAEIEHIFRVCEALWLHSGDPEQPHAELTSGKCSNGFVDTLRVLKNTNLCEIFSYQLYRKLIDVIANDPDTEGVDWVVGSDHAGATLSYSVARFFNAQHDFTEKQIVEDNNKPEGAMVKESEKIQVWKRFTIEPQETVLQVEELVTTSATIQAVRHGIRTGTPHEVKFVPVVGTLIHRSSVSEFEGAPIIHLAHFDIETWEQSACPLCAANSKRLKPKHAWDELTRIK